MEQSPTTTDEAQTDEFNTLVDLYNELTRTMQQAMAQLNELRLLIDDRQNAILQKEKDPNA